MQLPLKSSFIGGPYSTKVALNYLRERSKLKTITRFLFNVPILFLTVLLSGCGDSSQPEIILEATNCPADDITISVASSKTSSSGSQWNMRVIVEVKCAGKIMPNAELKMKFWWPGNEFKLKTGPDGKVMYRRRVAANPTGNTYSITIRGHDTERSESYTFQ